jgi:hypothetical protein
MFLFLGFNDLYCQVRTPEFAQLACDAVFGADCPGFAVCVQLQHTFGAEMNTDTTPFAPVGINYMGD